MGSAKQVFGGKQVSTKIPMRNLTAAAIARTGHALFGAKSVLDAQRLSGEVIVPNGNVTAFFRERAPRYGVPGIATTETKFDEAVIAVGRQLAGRIGRQDDVEPEKVERIAIEYVLTACATPTGAIEPFTKYYVTALKYRTAIKALNRARKVTSADAFASGDLGTIEQMNAEGKRAWKTITDILAASPFFATLRTQVDVPLLFQTMDEWRALRALDAEERDAMLTATEGIAARARNPIVDAEVLVAANATVRGNLLLSVGNPFGVDAATAIKAIGANEAANAQPNGGTKMTFTRTAPRHVLSALGGLHASLSGTIAATGDRTLRLELEAAEGEAGQGVVIPWMAPIPTARPSAPYAA